MRVGEQWGKEGNRPPPVKEAKEVKPDFGLSGALADETNKVDGVTLVYSEPPEAANTNTRWRLYTFKTGQLQHLSASARPLRELPKNAGKAILGPEL